MEVWDSDFLGMDFLGEAGNDLSISLAFQAWLPPLSEFGPRPKDPLKQLLSRFSSGSGAKGHRLAAPTRGLQGGRGVWAWPHKPFLRKGGVNRSKGGLELRISRKKGHNIILSSTAFYMEAVRVTFRGRLDTTPRRT